MAWGRRCDNGCESWPDNEEFKVCPKCDEETKRFSNLQPLDLDEARSIKAHIDFDAYYERRCARLGVPVEGPLPEKHNSPSDTRPRRVRGPSGGNAARASA